MIEFESVGKTFRDGTAAVVDLTLTVPSDKITVIVGPSGCGKTTTLRMVNRMIEPTSGRILWDGSPLKSKRKTTLRRQMGYVIQNGGLFPHRTVLDNVGTVPGLLGWDKTKTRNRSLELLDAVGLDRKLVDRYPAQLSGGQQQRVGVARALAADPLVMLMDEPFSAVDPVVRSELHELFLGLQRDLSKTIILITHDIDEAIKLGDQVAILRVGGHLAQVGTPQQLLDEPADAFVEGFVGRDRGFRALSFLPASNLSLTRVRAVRDPSSVTSHEPTLVVDGEAKPLGWADGRRAGQVYGLGSTFDPETDSLRAALDAALTSPVGMAVAVSHGRYAGVARAEEILAHATASRVSVAESASGTPAVAAGSDDAAPRDPAPEVSSGDNVPSGSSDGVSDSSSDGAAGEDTSVSSRSDDTRVTLAASTSSSDADAEPSGGDEAGADEARVDQWQSDSHTDTADEQSAGTDPVPRPEHEPGGAHALVPPGDAQEQRPVEPATATVDRPESDRGRDFSEQDGDRQDQSGPETGPGGTEQRESPAAQRTDGSRARSASSEHQQAGLRELGFQGRASEEPGLTSDEFDGARTPWNPFKRPQ